VVHDLLGRQFVLRVRELLLNEFVDFDEGKILTRKHFLLFFAECLVEDLADHTFLAH